MMPPPRAKRSSGQACARAATDDRNIVLDCELDDPRDFAGAGGKNHQFRARPVHRAVVFVQRQIFRAMSTFRGPRSD